MESWQIKSAMSAIDTDMRDWRSKAVEAFRQGDFKTGHIRNSIAKEGMQMWRGANRQLEEMTGKPITEYDYVSEYRQDGRPVTQATLRWDATELKLKHEAAARWYGNASQYASKGDHHMRDFCTNEGNKCTWQAGERQTELDAMRRHLDIANSYGFDQPHTAYQPGSRGFVM